ncbi:MULTISPECIES: CYTH domain-containing protein [unclassified Enterococcus]|uniref:CYTH domain-containing protein n=1 Tax=unclassified Enterococcus TaxID=2608891 RepID=UPI0013ED3908|nr:MULTISPECIES: CYTH domain-containing protein [unclassified Enterococcus]
MSQMLEIEFKTMLTEKEYHQLLEYYQLTPENFHIQTNIYFDTPEEELKKKNSGLRVRLLDDHAEYTLKTPAEDGRLETTDTLDKKHAADLIEKNELPREGVVSKKLEELSVDPSQLIKTGELVTKRAEFHIDEGLLAIDQSWGQQLNDFELELEVKDASNGKEAFEQLLKRFSLPYRPAKNKIQRMLEAKN